jgi:hypothetical protein
VNEMARRLVEHGELLIRQIWRIKLCNADIVLALNEVDKPILRPSREVPPRGPCLRTEENRKCHFTEKRS